MRLVFVGAAVPLAGVQLVGALREKRFAKKIKKRGAARGSEERLWINLTKGPAAYLHTIYRDPNMTAGLWFSVVNVILKHVHGTFQTLSFESQYSETNLAIEIDLNKVLTPHCKLQR